mmetsp:Transcript_15891/g.62097  ORF Transcript_15891/g.62097 Transcript_15891/m.62097 type:complete len:206 (+) Transcript_15891:461-1078(+)
MGDLASRGRTCWRGLTTGSSTAWSWRSNWRAFSRLISRAVLSSCWSCFLSASAFSASSSSRLMRPACASSVLAWFSFSFCSCFTSRSASSSSPRTCRRFLSFSRICADSSALPSSACWRRLFSEANFASEAFSFSSNRFLVRSALCSDSERRASSTSICTLEALSWTSWSWAVLSRSTAWASRASSASSTRAFCLSLSDLRASVA